MNRSTRERELAQKARNAFREEQMRRSDAVLAEEDMRRAAASKKTARLRELRARQGGPSARRRRPGVS